MKSVARVLVLNSDWQPEKAMTLPPDSWDLLPPAVKGALRESGPQFSNTSDTMTTWMEFQRKSSGFGHEDASSLVRGVETHLQLNHNWNYNFFNPLQFWNGYLHHVVLFPPLYLISSKSLFTYWISNRDIIDEKLLQYISLSLSVQSIIYAPSPNKKREIFKFL